MNCSPSLKAPKQQKKKKELVKDKIHLDNSEINHVSESLGTMHVKVSDDHNCNFELGQPAEV